MNHRRTPAFARRPLGPLTAIVGALLLGGCGDPAPELDPRFPSGVVATKVGECGGYGAGKLPGVVLGPPVGGGASQGSLDVYSLGTGGSITLQFGDESGNHQIINGDGPDFTVFENAFFVAGSTTEMYAEPGEVSVSQDGTSWATLPCDASNTTWCAGMAPSFSSPENGISAFDPAVSGGKSYDLADFHLARARYVKITDRGAQACVTGSNGPTSNGFDLDGISVIHHD